MSLKAHHYTYFLQYSELVAACRNLTRRVPELPIDTKKSVFFRSDWDQSRSVPETSTVALIIFYWQWQMLHWGPTEPTSWFFHSLYLLVNQWTLYKGQSLFCSEHENLIERLPSSQFLLRKYLTVEADRWME